MAVPYTYRSLIERIVKHMNNGFPNDSVSYTYNEVLLHIQQAAATGLIGMVYGAAKVTGNIEVPEGYLTTYQLPALVQNTVTKEWYTTLPQTPISLPLGHSLSECYFADDINGKGIQVNLIKGKRAAYRNDMPIQFGVNAKVEKKKITFVASDGSPLLSKTCYVTMATTRAENLDDELTMPDDAIEAIFTKVTNILIQRLQQNKDIISDGLPAGNKAS
jgi:hypothetical protein